MIPLRIQGAGRLWKCVGQPTQRPASSRSEEGRLGRGPGRGSEVRVVECGGWEELEEGGGLELGPESRTRVYWERCWVLKERQVEGNEWRVMGAQRRSQVDAQEKGHRVCIPKLGGRGSFVGPAEEHLPVESKRPLHFP